MPFMVITAKSALIEFNRTETLSTAIQWAHTERIRCIWCWTEAKGLYVAKILQTGAVSLIPVLEDGSLGKIKELYFISGNGGPGYISHPHQTMLDRSGRWLAVPSQGRLQGVGKITLFEINGTEGTLRKHFAIKGRTGAEPRHCVFAPSNRFCYCVNEKDSTVAAYRFDENEGTLEPMQILTSLPEDYAGDGWASAIDMDAGGKDPVCIEPQA